MKIVLVEDRSGQLHGERTFTGEVVLVGRDPAVCHYSFSQQQWPMVSRKHAEFRLGEGRCHVVDANSRFGTFVNGQRITNPAEVRAGSHVQFGVGGPILRVVSIEQSAVSSVEPKSPDLRRIATVHESRNPIPEIPRAAPATAPPPSANQKLPPERARTELAHLDLIDLETRRTTRIDLNREVTRLGRDPEGEVVIDAAAAVVSRRHAEIKRSGLQFAISDLKSFNGTLVNGKRITETVPLFDLDEIQLGG